MNETLSIPEEHLSAVIEIIRNGLDCQKVKKSVRQNLLQWCLEEEEYLLRRSEDEHLYNCTS